MPLDGGVSNGGRFALVLPDLSFGTYPFFLDFPIFLGDCPDLSFSSFSDC